MSGFQIIAEDMVAASNAATEAAGHAMGHDSSGAVTTAGEALRGSDTALFLPVLGSGWHKEIRDWANDTQSFGTYIAELSAEYQRTDGLVRPTIVELSDRVGRN